MKIVILKPPYGIILTHWHGSYPFHHMIRKKWKKYKNGTIGVCCLKCKTRWIRRKEDETNTSK